MKIFFITSITFFLTVGNLLSATTHYDKLKRKLSNHSSKVHTLAAKIKDLDQRIGLTNNSYLDNVKMIEKLNNKIVILKDELQTSALEISSDYKNTKKLLNLYLLERTDEENDEGLYHQQVYFELLQKKVKELKKAETSSNDLLAAISSYEQVLNKTKKKEEEIYNLIIELENRKKLMSQNYMTQLESKNKIESNLEMVEAKKKAYSKVYKKTKSSNKNMKMEIPIQKFVSAKKGKKGLVLNFQETTPVYAPSSGTIVYTGELASYGNVIMVDHGKDVRSVILGDMSIKIKKGDIVNKSQVIGYTLADPGVIKSLYFEIRKKNIAQNTMSWLAKNNIESLKI